MNNRFKTLTQNKVVEIKQRLQSPQVVMREFGANFTPVPKNISPLTIVKNTQVIPGMRDPLLKFVAPDVRE